jgi:murein DD-endopeptidase MepM/ murein hydrolase activator NlpD
MHLTRITSAKKQGFKRSSLHRRKEKRGQAASYLKQKSSFFMAALSLTAFVAGNMAGEHGWYAFWKAVLGNADDALIAYTGTVTPVEFVPDYTKWSAYGGNGEEHTFRQVPKDLLIPLPNYDQAQAERGLDMTGTYSVGNMGSYETGAEGAGSHPGVDIRVPMGTPVRSIANGIVEQVREDAGGYGYYVVIRHPHIPDPANPKKETVLHSVYAHLSSQLVREGDIVEKGQEIALSGQSGFVTGPHLHFQIDRDDAPWHPYWPFTGAEARAAGLTTTSAVDAAFHQERLKEYTVHPMLLVQANRGPAKYDKDGSSAVATKPTESHRRTRDEIERVREERKNARLARLQKEEGAHAAAAVAQAPVVPTVITPDAIPTGSVAIASPTAPIRSTSGNPVASFEIQSARQYVGREWMTVRVTLLDESGNKTDEDQLEKDVYLRTAYGEAEFDPPVLRKEDFTDGVATVRMLPRGNRTIVILLQPYAFQSQPIVPTK